MRSSPRAQTRFYDAVAMALEMLDHETGRRAVLALTDGEDTFSQSATLESVVGSAQAAGLPVYTLGLGSEEEIESNDLRRLATSTRGQYYPAAMPTISARSTNRSPSESGRVTRWSIRAIASSRTAPCGRCASSIAPARRLARLPCSSPEWSFPPAAGRRCSSSSWPG